MVDVAEFALNFINDYVLKRLNKEDKKDFRSRTRQLYSMAYFENLKSTIAFAYSKAKENAVKSLVENKEINVKDSKKDYAYYLLGIIKLLEKEGYYQDRVDGSIDSLMKAIKDKSIENKILNYMKWLKYFAEAKIEGE
jgi:CRISPR type III-B/RAMP module-associated protein Cmr5